MSDKKQKWERPESARVEQLFESVEFKARPDFVHASDAAPEVFCLLCLNIMIQPVHSPCNGWACKQCITERFEGKQRMMCPFPEHENCRGKDILYKDILPDYKLFEFLLSSKSYCTNHNSGCEFRDRWLKVIRHEELCVFQLVCCPNDECEEKFYRKDERHHMENCERRSKKCPICFIAFPVQLAEEHTRVCEKGETMCENCGTIFDRHLQLTVHEKTSHMCLKEAGECLYYAYCKFETNDLEKLKKHMIEKEVIHLHAVTALVLRMQRLLPLMKAEWSMTVRKQVLGLVRPIERELLGSAMKLKRDERKISEMMESVSTLVTDASSYKRDDKMAEMNKQVVEMQMEMKIGRRADSVPLESTLKYIDKHVKLIKGMKEIAQTPRIVSCDGKMLWRIADYAELKASSSQTENRSQTSEEFYTSPFGYRMVCKAYLDGNGGGRGTHLSLFLVLLKSEYDDIHRFPFSRKIKFTLRCPSDGTRDISHTIEPEAGENSFVRPSDEYNTPLGFECFADHATVESSDYLVEGSLFVEVSVEKGNDFIRGYQQ